MCLLAAGGGAWRLLARRRRRRRRRSQDFQIDILAKVLSSWELPKILRSQAETKKCRGNAALLFAQNFDTHLAGIVILSDGPYFEWFPRGPKHR